MWVAQPHLVQDLRLAEPGLCHLREIGVWYETTCVQGTHMRAEGGGAQQDGRAPTQQRQPACSCQGSNCNELAMRCLCRPLPAIATTLAGAAARAPGCAVAASAPPARRTFGPLPAAHCQRCPLRDTAAAGGIDRTVSTWGVPPAASAAQHRSICCAGHSMSSWRAAGHRAHRGIAGVRHQLFCYER